MQAAGHKMAAEAVGVSEHEAEQLLEVVHVDVDEIAGRVARVAVQRVLYSLVYLWKLWRVSL